MPEHPQTSAVGKSIATHNKARPGREAGIGKLAGAFPASPSCSNLIVQTLSTLLDVGYGYTKRGDTEWKSRLSTGINPVRQVHQSAAGWT